MKAVFYCKGVDLKGLMTVNFYKQNISVLNEVFSEVVICNKYKDIPDDFDLMFVYWWTYALVPVLKARLKGKPVIITGAYNFKLPKYEGSVDYLRRPLHQRFLIRLATKLATLNLVNSKYEKNQLVEHFNIDNCGVSYLSYTDSLIQPHISPPSKRLEEFEFKGLLKNAVFNICWLQETNLIRKGVLELITAFDQSIDECDVGQVLVCAGRTGDGKGMFDGALEQVKSRDRIIHIGEISEAEKAYLMQRCKIYAQPSRYEGFGLATLEAVVCGAKVIAVDVGAVKEVIGDCGLYIDLDSKDELKNAIQHLLSSSSEVESANFHVVREKFSESNFRSKLKEFIASVIELKN